MKNYILAALLFFPLFARAEDLPVATVKRIAARAAQYASKKNWKVSVAVVNAEGNLVYFERGDGTPFGSISSSQEKAGSSNAFQRPTSAFVEAIKSGRTGLMTGKNVVAIEGGVPIVINGKHAGAIGVSGAKAIEDEEIANDAVKALTEK